MEKKQFTITIDAPREKVWETLWGDDTYPQWTAPFSPSDENSRAITDWQKGSKVLFVGGDGGDGMVSMIADNIPGEFMSFKHLGMVLNGVEDTTSEKVKDWQGAMENYTLKTTNGQTELIVDIDITAEYMDYFIEKWPKALSKLKEVAER